ncbi:MAG: c-type cytochrome [Polyangiaceae bacterium]|nr:c-type cytochrome [Polyangiaceae bacterium]
MVYETPGALALLDTSGATTSALDAPPGAKALAAFADLLLVGGPTSPDLWAYRLQGSALVRAPERDVHAFAARGVRSLATTNRCIYGVDQRSDELRFHCGDRAGAVPVPRGPTQVVATPDHVLVTSPVSHVVTVFDATERGPVTSPIATIPNDGPLFVTSAAERGGDLFVASGGVENHPLDRRGGSFGYVDSFLYVHLVGKGHVDTVAAINVGEHGVVTPRALLTHIDGDALVVTAAAYGSDRGAVITVPLSQRAGSSTEPRVTTFAAAPGIVALARTADGTLLGASRILDGIIALGDEPHRLESTPLEVDAEDAELRLGEAMFFTTAMAPWQSSEGPLSRFTCETCHFEGGIDGRIHATGRADIVATTKPLFGLLNNGPHFTRALDEDMATMIFAEFRVAAKNSGHDAWFDLGEAPIEWIRREPWYGATAHDAPALRHALFSYLASSPHPPPEGAGRDHFDVSEQRGAEVFEDRCASCHAARLIASDPQSEVAFDDWEGLVLSTAGPIVWARDGYEKTGVVPYVHTDGARPSSLRRISRKTPLFTNGTARSLEEVVEGARFDAGTFFHAGGSARAERLDAQQARDLVAFLKLL